MTIAHLQNKIKTARWQVVQRQKSHTIKNDVILRPIICFTQYVTSWLHIGISLVFLIYVSSAVSYTSIGCSVWWIKTRTNNNVSFYLLNSFLTVGNSKSWPRALNCMGPDSPSFYCAQVSEAMTSAVIHDVYDVELQRLSNTNSRVITLLSNTRVRARNERAYLTATGLKQFLWMQVACAQAGGRTLRTAWTVGRSDGRTDGAASVSEVEYNAL